MVATDASLCCSVTGVPGAAVENISLSNVNITYRGGGLLCSIEEAVPEVEEKYPDPRMFGALPSYGLFCRHARGVTLSNVRLALGERFWRFNYTDHDDVVWDTPDGIPTPTMPGHAGRALVFDDVEDLVIDLLRAEGSAEGEPVVMLRDVTQARIRGAVPGVGTKVFLEVAGKASRAIRLGELDGSFVEEPVRALKGGSGRRGWIRKRIGRGQARLMERAGLLGAAGR